MLFSLFLFGISLASDTPEYLLGPGDEILIEVFDSTNTEILLLYKENITGYKPYDIGNPLAGNRFVIPYNGNIDIPCFGKFRDQRIGVILAAQSGPPGLQVAEKYPVVDHTQAVFFIEIFYLYCFTHLDIVHKRFFNFAKDNYS